MFMKELFRVHSPVTHQQISTLSMIQRRARFYQFLQTATISNWLTNIMNL